MFVVTEAAAYWAPDMMWKWDQYMGGGHTTKKLAAMLEGKISKLPSDYFGTNIFIGASTMSKEEIRRRYVIGTDVVMWGTDYPHPEGTWPNTTARLRADFAVGAVDDTAELLGLTAAEVYGFDLDAARGRSPQGSAPQPDSLGQDPTLRSDPRGSGPGQVVEGGVRGAADRGVMPPRAARSPGAQHLVAVEGVAGRVGRVILDRPGGSRPRPPSGRSGPATGRRASRSKPYSSAALASSIAASRPGRTRRTPPAGRLAGCRGRSLRSGDSPRPT